jgi:hypothetical protein
MWVKLILIKERRSTEMLMPKTAYKAEVMPTPGSEGRVNLWADSVGEAVGQLGIIVTLAIVAHFASTLLYGFTNAMR